MFFRGSTAQNARSSVIYCNFDVLFKRFKNNFAETFKAVWLHWRIDSYGFIRDITAKMQGFI